MTYGINSPIGLVPHSYLNGQPYTGALSSFPIMSGTVGNIFTGDPVIIDTSSGGIRRLAIDTTNSTGPDKASELTATTTVTTTPPILGVFAGCKYQAYVNGVLEVVRSPYWVNGQATFGSIPAEAMIVVADPELLFDIQISTSLTSATNTSFNATYAGASKLIVGNYLTLGIGITNGSGGAGNAIPSSTYYYDDGTALAANPTAGSMSTGKSAFYADIGALTGGTSGKGVTTYTGHHLQVIKLTERIDQVVYPNLGSGYATAFGGITTTTPYSISDGSFNNVLVKISNRAA